MPPKKNLADLKAREADLAARFMGKKKRVEDPAAWGTELRRLKKGPRDPPARKEVEVVTQATPEKGIPKGIPLKEVRGKGLQIGGPSGAVESVQARIRGALLPGDVRRYESQPPGAIVDWLYSLSNFVSSILHRYLSAFFLSFFFIIFFDPLLIDRVAVFAGRVLGCRGGEGPAKAWRAGRGC